MMPIDDAAAHFRCTRFLNHEANLLDTQQLSAWLDLLTEDIEYRVPRRVTRERGSERSEFSDDSFHFKDDLGTLQTRVERFDSEFAWSENPPNRTRRFVSNVRVMDIEEGEYTVRSNLLFYRSQGEDADGTVISGERLDTLREVEDDLKLARRHVFLDHSVIPLKNFTVPL